MCQWDDPLARGVKKVLSLAAQSGLPNYQEQHRQHCLARPDENPNDREFESVTSPKTRLFVESPLAQGLQCSVSPDQAHYLNSVLRLKEGAQVALFNGKDGVWAATLEGARKRQAQLRCTDQIAPQGGPADLWLAFAPIKKARTDFIVEKAAELGAAKIMPVMTEFTNSERIKQERLQAHAIEAAEQCGASYVAQVCALQKLCDFLGALPEGRHLFFADEALAGACPEAQVLPGGAAVILIGPEGGFSQAERARIKSHPAATPLRLGPRVLRADTAAVAALTLWQAQCGDWVHPAAAP